MAKSFPMHRTPGRSLPLARPPLSPRFPYEKRSLQDGLASWASEGVGRAVGGPGGSGEVALVVGAMSQRARGNVSPSSSSFSAPEAQRETVFVCASCNQTLSK